MLSLIFLISLAVSQISFVLREASILKKPRDFFNKSNLIKELLNCKLCLNFWPSLIATGIEVYLQRIGLFEDYYFLFSVWALAYMIDAAREKYLPCGKCKEQGDLTAGNYKVIS